MHPATINNDISMNQKGCVSFVLKLVYTPPGQPGHFPFQRSLQWPSSGTFGMI